MEDFIFSYYEQNNMDEFGKEESQVGSVENIRGQDLVFSHQALVMTALRKCFEKLSQEGRTGIYEQYIDAKGNRKIVYKPDTRLEFFNSCEGAIAIMTCDFDPEVSEKISNLKAESRRCFDKWLNFQKRWFESLKYEGKEDVVGKGFNPIIPALQKVGGIDYEDEYISDVLHLYTKIFTELNNMTKRKDFYKGEVVRM